MRLSIAHYGRALQAVGALLRAQWSLRRYPFSRIANELKEPLPSTQQDGDALRIALDVRMALVAASRRLPWTPTCLVRAMAGQAMLKRRGIPSVLVLSVMPNESVTLKAHAWLEAAGTVVIGRNEMNSYTPIFRFDNNPPQNDAPPSRAVASCSR